ncbi:MAG: gamma-glutamyl-gamma-aminobutyrate hydrolase family protein [Syntrophomonas sp.]
MRPLIGITGNFDADEDAVLLKGYYVESVNRAGGVAMVLPPVRDDNIINNYLSVCQGFVLSGGGDIDPVYWGENPAVELGEVNPLRDFFELSLTRKIITANLPVLGICRGCQVLNVAAGGSIVQNITSDISHDQNAPRSYPFHAIFIEKHSLLASITQSESIPVNSFHHQAVHKPGYRMQISACAPDGTIEAIEAAGHPFCIGVQWHPECMLDMVSKRLFNALVNASHCE